MRHSLERRATEAAGKWPGGSCREPQSIVHSRYVLIEQREHRVRNGGARATPTPHVTKHEAKREY